MPERVFIGLGSNLNNPVQQVTQALAELADLPQTRLLKSSSLYRSDPIGPQDQPDFINAVALLETQLAPHALLDALQALEQAHRRQRLQHWGPRTLDLDILLFGQQHLQTDRLNIPHPYAYERNFVLWPLAEIAPELIFPDGRHLKTLLAQCPLGTLENISV